MPTSTGSAGSGVASTDFTTAIGGGAARRVSPALDGLQHLPQVPARRRLGRDLGRTPGGAARTRGALDEFYRVAFRKKIYGAIAELQADLDLWLKAYNEERPHQGRWCFGKTPMQTFLDAIPLAKEKVIAA